MTTLYDIARFCDAFEEQVSAINHLKLESVPEKNIAHIQLYKKSLVMSAIDTLAGFRFTKENYKELNKQNKKRFVRFIAEFGEWENGPFISVPYLFEQLAKRDLKECELYGALCDKLIRYEGNDEGTILHIEDIDVMAVELFELAKTEYEEQLILKSQHYSLFYEYRNCKANTLSESGGVMEAFQYAQPNYYSYKKSEHHDLTQWQLSYPLAHFNGLFSRSLRNMRQYFIKTNINPYSLVTDDRWGAP
ncbi:MAG: hypothetical protein BMS9Abin31_0922 [Gammaproteobacteria bacterium]|nr:MAG: hypothetical protein BMS9Abin31_0922 [Gammaproteobacteria bacterium]